MTVFDRAVCREEKKDGVCPKLSRDQCSDRSDECGSDSDCSGDKKCCYNGCAYSCLKAVKDPGAQVLGGGGTNEKDDIIPIGGYFSQFASRHSEYKCKSVL